MGYQGLKKTVQDVSNTNWAALYAQLSIYHKTILENYCSININALPEVILPGYGSFNYYSKEVNIKKRNLREVGVRFDITVTMDNEELEFKYVKTNNKGMNLLLDYPIKRKQYLQAQKILMKQKKNTEQMVESLVKLQSADFDSKDIEQFTNIFNHEMLLFIMMIGFPTETQMMLLKHLDKINHSLLKNFDNLENYQARVLSVIATDISNISTPEIQKVLLVANKHLQKTLINAFATTEKLMVLHTKDRLEKVLPEKQLTKQRIKI